MRSLSSNGAKQVDTVPDEQTAGHVARAALIPDEAVRLEAAARQKDVTLRIAGSVGVHLGCPVWRGYLPGMGGKHFTTSTTGRRAKTRRSWKAFASEGYQADPKIKHMHEWGVKRLIFDHPGTGIKIDVFMMSS